MSFNLRYPTYVILFSQFVSSHPVLFSRTRSYSHIFKSFTTTHTLHLPPSTSTRSHRRALTSLPTLPSHVRYKIRERNSLALYVKTLNGPAASGSVAKAESIYTGAFTRLAAPLHTDTLRARTNEGVLVLPALLSACGPMW